MRVIRSVRLSEKIQGRRAYAAALGIEAVKEGPDPQPRPCSKAAGKAQQTQTGKSEGRKRWKL